MAGVLIIDDDQGVCKMLIDMVHRMDHEAWCAQSLQEGLAQSSSQDFDAVFLDVDLPDGNGIDALPTIRENRSAPEVIMITGEGDPDGAELAVKNGGLDYLEEPLSTKTIELPPEGPRVGRQRPGSSLRCKDLRPLRHRNQGLLPGVL